MPPNRDAAASIISSRIEVDGTVQGVGFRPFVWRLANELGLSGVVRNVGGRVEIEASGPAGDIERLAARLHAEAPPRAVVESVTVTPVRGPTRRGTGFTVAASGTGGGVQRLFPPDLATCPACVRELFDPADRRYRYPFINCTDCGPRASIIDSLPYDRVRTTMADFPLCAACRREYEDPADRRFHAEPVACPACGPRLRWNPVSSPVSAHPDGAGPVPGVHGDEALRAAARLLADGGIVAVKGIGGYHLACSATDSAAVRRLRERKHRWAKPLAVMVADLAAARRLAAVDDACVEALTGTAHPIVLLDLLEPPNGRPPDGPEPGVAAEVLAGSRRIGLFLPYTGLHHLLLAELAGPLVLTSGNRSDEPIAVGDGEALATLSGIADGFLSHDRRIRSRYEDSVVTIAGGAPVLLRRGRGHAPQPLRLPVPAPEPILAVGAQLKHTFAIARGERVYVGGHTGDLADLAALESYERDLAHLRRLLDTDPAYVAHDLHPGYLSTRQAVEGFPASRRVAVQHHHAHVASCLAEHGLTGPVVGVALDGLGLGDDGTLWGGEVLVADLVGYRRVGRFGRAPLPGGEAAVRHPWRMALGYLFGAEGDDAAASGGDPDANGVADAADRVDAALFLRRHDPAAVAVVRRQIARGFNSPVASSAGRLFDAASSLLGLCDTVSYEGQAAIALENAADPDEPGELPCRLTERDGLAVFDPRPTLAALLTGLAAGVPASCLAARFQRTVAVAITGLAVGAARDAGLDVVCLSGGVFHNRFLLAEVPRRLAAEGLRVLHNRRVPAGDGGISLGQAAVAAARLAAGAPAPTHLQPPDIRGESPCA